MLYSNTKLQKTKRYEEYQTLKDKYYKLSLTKEQGQQSFLKYNMILRNQSTNEVLDINYNFEKYYKKYTKSIEQKIYTIEAIAKEKNLVPVFITLTLPTQYHPFKSIKYKDKRLYCSKSSNNRIFRNKHNKQICKSNNKNKCRNTNNKQLK